MPEQIFMLYSIIRAMVFTDEPVLIDVLQDNIETFIRETAAEMLDSVCQNRRKQLDHLTLSLLINHSFQSQLSCDQAFMSLSRN